MISPQLLAPAGDFSSVDAALDHGADAVYVGIGPYNLRAHAPNFALQDLSELLDRVHAGNRRIYFALNIMPGPEQIPEIESLVRKLRLDTLLPDAFIVSDPGVVHLCRELIPDVPLHLSTQTGTFNQRSLRFWQQQGIRRVVLPRELNLKQISDLASTGILETEIFIHGAMCVSVSGRCLMGAYFSGRHPNRGDCPQPCRWSYRITPLMSDSGNPLQEPWLEAEENNNGTYLLNARDLCTIEILPGLIRSGVTALKIEGRNKSAHYIAAVVKTYRAAIDLFIRNPQEYTVPDEWKTLLASIDHRPYTTGFYTGELQMQEVFSSKATSASRIVGVVKGHLKENLPVIDVKNSFSIDETLEVLPVNQSRTPFPVSISRCTDLCGNVLDRISSNRVIAVHSSESLQRGDMLRRTIS
ncbi:MAG: U32 family peptidase C-terminal domain-containing protein [Chitinispirillaceae bacterium]|nr:U32 family peptidase C-terminal domain-containing protein [Chitinispirillaceae bacterium]